MSSPTTLDRKVFGLGSGTQKFEEHQRCLVVLLFFKVVGRDGYLGSAVVASRTKVIRGYEREYTATRPTQPKIVQDQSSLILVPGIHEDSGTPSDSGLHFSVGRNPFRRLISGQRPKIALRCHSESTSQVWKKNNHYFC